MIFDCERMKYGYTGLYEYCIQLGRALQALKSPGDSLGFYLPEDLAKHFEGADEFLYQHSLHKFIFPRYKHVDLWHTAYQLSSYIPKNRKIKHVLTVHDLNFLHEGKSNTKIKNYLAKHQKNIDRADHIIAISEFTKTDVLTHLKTFDKPITVIYNGCSDTVLSPTTLPKVLPERPFLFSLGTVNPKKNFHVLIPLLKNNELELIIGGKIEGDYKEKIMMDAVKHGVVNRVKVIGGVSEQDKYWYYKNCEAFLFPSLAEGFGIPAIEAMRYGKPVFLSDKTSLPEIGGDEAYYFNSFDPEDMQAAFDKGMKHYQLNQPTEKIIGRANKFNWESSAKSYLKVYKDTLSG